MKERSIMFSEQIYSKNYYQAHKEKIINQAISAITELVNKIVPSEEELIKFFEGLSWEEGVGLITFSQTMQPIDLARKFRTEMLKRIE